MTLEDKHNLIVSLKKQNKLISEQLNIFNKIINDCFIEINYNEFINNCFLLIDNDNKLIFGKLKEEINLEQFKFSKDFFEKKINKLENMFKNNNHNINEYIEKIYINPKKKLSNDINSIKNIINKIKEHHKGHNKITKYFNNIKETIDKNKEMHHEYFKKRIQNLNNNVEKNSTQNNELNISQNKIEEYRIYLKEHLDSLLYYLNHEYINTNDLLSFYNVIEKDFKNGFEENTGIKQFTYFKINGVRKEFDEDNLKNTMFKIIYSIYLNIINYISTGKDKNLNLYSNDVKKIYKKYYNNLIKIYYEKIMKLNKEIIRKGYKYIKKYFESFLTIDEQIKNSFTRNNSLNKELINNASFNIKNERKKLVKIQELLKNKIKNIKIDEYSSSTSITTLKEIISSFINDKDIINYFNESYFNVKGKSYKKNDIFNDINNFSKFICEIIIYLNIDIKFNLNENNEKEYYYITALLILICYIISSETNYPFINNITEQIKVIYNNPNIYLNSFHKISYLKIFINKKYIAEEEFKKFLNDFIDLFIISNIKETSIEQNSIEQEPITNITRYQSRNLKSKNINSNIKKRLNTFIKNNPDLNKKLKNEIEKEKINIKYLKRLLGLEASKYQGKNPNHEKKLKSYITLYSELSKISENNKVLSIKNKNKLLPIENIKNRNFKISEISEISEESDESEVYDESEESEESDVSEESDESEVYDESEVSDESDESEVSDESDEHVRSENGIKQIISKKSNNIQNLCDYIKNYSVIHNNNINGTRNHHYVYIKTLKENIIKKFEITVPNTSNNTYKHFKENIEDYIKNLKKSNKTSSGLRVIKESSSTNKTNIEFELIKQDLLFGLEIIDLLYILNIYLKKNNLKVPKIYDTYKNTLNSTKNIHRDFKNILSRKNKNYFEFSTSSNTKNNLVKLVKTDLVDLNKLKEFLKKYLNCK